MNLPILEFLFQCYFLYKRHTHFSTLSVYTVIFNPIIITWYTLYTTINCTPFYNSPNRMAEIFFFMSFYSFFSVSVSASPVTVLSLTAGASCSSVACSARRFFNFCSFLYNTTINAAVTSNPTITHNK